MMIHEGCWNPPTGNRTIFDFVSFLDGCNLTEKQLWEKLSCVTASVSEQIPIDRLAQNSLCNWSTAGDCPVVGVIPVSLYGLDAVTPEAYNTGISSFNEALAWSIQQSIDDAESRQSTMLDFSRAYLQGAMSLAKSSAVGAAICYGVGLRAARLMQCAGIDKLAIEIFLRHFGLKFSLMGSNANLYDICRDPVQVALVDWMQAKPKLRLQRRTTFIRRAFRVEGKLQGKHVELCSTMQSKELENLLALCTRLGVALPTAQRFLQLYGIDSVAAYNLARRFLRKSSRRRIPVAIPRANKTELIVQVCKSLMERALDGPYTTAMLIEAFMWAALAAVRITRVDNAVGSEGFWITWLEKKTFRYLQSLAYYCGADDSCSAKNNVMGAEPNNVAV